MHDRADGSAPPSGGEAGWYQDPTDPLEHRYWDGLRWGPPGATPEEAATDVGGGGHADRRPGVSAGELWWDPRSDQLVWSAEAAVLHGYHGTLPTVTRELMLSHVVDSDRAGVAACFAEGRRRHAQLRSHHRMHGTDGVGREVILVAALVDEGTTSVYHGFLVDLGSQMVQAANTAVAAARRGNGSVQRAVGVLCVVLGVDTEGALAVLRRTSASTNVKMRDLAERVVEAVATVPADEPGRAVEAIGRLLRGAEDRPVSDRWPPAPGG